MLLVHGDICEEVHSVKLLGNPLFDCPVEDSMPFVIHVVKGSFHPSEK